MNATMKGRVKVKDFIIYIVIFFISTIIAAIVESNLTQLIPLVDISLSLAIVYVLSFGLASFGIVKYRNIMSASRGYEATLPKLGRVIPIYLIIGVVYMLAESVALDPLVHLFPNAIEDYFELFGNNSLLTSIFTAVIAAPIFEEYLFRGIILRDIASRWGVKWAIVISALIFGVIHINTIQIVTATIAGLFWGYIYYRTNYSLITVIIMHALNNAAAMAMLHLSNEPFGTPLIEQLGKPLFYPLFVIGSAIILFLIYKVFTIKYQTS